MKLENAWRLVADAAQGGVHSEIEQLSLCDALATLADALNLRKERRAAERLATAIRAKDLAQLQFRDLLAETEEEGR